MPILGIGKPSIEMATDNYIEHKMQASPTNTAPVPTVSDIDTRLFDGLRRALVELRQVVDIGDFIFRFQKSGDKFEHDGQTRIAFETGVYARFPVARGNVSAGQWASIGLTDAELKSFVQPELRPLTAQAREDLLLAIAAGTAHKDSTKDASALAAPAAIVAPAARPAPAPRRARP